MSCAGMGVIVTKNRKFWAFKAAEPGVGELQLYGEISDRSWWGDEVTPKQFAADLDALGDINELRVYINSPGGDVFAGQAIYSILKRHKAQVHVYIDGLAASIASLVAMAGDTITMSANAMMMVHMPWTFAVGNAAELRKMADDLDKIGESMVVTYEGRSALTHEEVVALLEAETWLTAQDCLDRGLCDEVEDAKEVAACWDPAALARYRNTPATVLAAKQPEPEPEPDKPAVDDELRRRRLALELDLI